jgi:hypothetical protein
MRAFLCAAVLTLSISTSALAQGTNSSPSVSLINPKLPFVYLIFDHIGPGVPEFESEPPMRIWLRLVNNSSMRIKVRTQPIPAGRPRGEVGVVDEIRRHSGVMLCAAMGTPTVSEPSVANKLVEPGEKPEQVPPREHVVASPETSPPGCMDEAPIGYGDIPEYQTSESYIDSGKDALFSVPSNHIAISGFWFIQIPFSFTSIPTDTRNNGNLNWGGSVSSAIEYGLYDIPKDHRDEFRAAYSPWRPSTQE